MSVPAAIMRCMDINAKDTDARDSETAETQATDTHAMKVDTTHTVEVDGGGQQTNIGDGARVAAPDRPAFPPGLTDVSTETLRRLADRMESYDPSAAPDFAGAIAAVLGSRLEANSVPDDVLETISDLLAAPATGQDGTGATDSGVSPDPPTA